MMKGDNVKNSDDYDIYFTKKNIVCQSLIPSILDRYRLLHGHETGFVLRQFRGHACS